MPEVSQANKGVFIKVHNGYGPEAGPKSIPINLDFTASTEYTIDLQNEQATDRIEFIQSIFVDNSKNTTELDIYVPATQQTLRWPKNRQGYLPVLSPNPPNFVITCTGGGSVQTIIQFLTMPMPAFLWGDCCDTSFPEIINVKGILGNNSDAVVPVTTGNVGTDSYGYAFDGTNWNRLSAKVPAQMLVSTLKPFVNTNSVIYGTSIDSLNINFASIGQYGGFDNIPRNNNALLVSNFNMLYNNTGGYQAWDREYSYNSIPSGTTGAGLAAAGIFAEQQKTAGTFNRLQTVNISTDNPDNSIPANALLCSTNIIGLEPSITAFNSPLSFLSTYFLNAGNSTSSGFGSGLSVAPSDYSGQSTPISISSGNVANSVANAVLAADTTGLTTFITGFEVTGSGATAGLPVIVTVSDGAALSLSYIYTATVGALLPNAQLIIEFAKPIPASAADTAITVSCPALGIGNTHNCVTAHGFIGPGQ